MNDNFSPRVKRIFTYSKEEAVRLGQSTVGTEHFILAILQENEGSAINLLRNLNIDMEKLRQNIHTLTSARGLNPPNFNAVHFTVQAERAMQATYLEAKRMQSDVINTAHLLLSILRNENDPTTKVFNKLGLNYETARDSFQPIEDNNSKLITPTMPTNEVDEYDRDYRLPHESRNNRNLQGQGQGQYNQRKNTVLDTCEKIAKRVNEAVIDGYRPILIGGDHSISLGSVSGVSLEKEIGVLWISAHGDMNTPESTLTGNIHGMPLALLQGLGDRELVNCFYEGAKLDSRNIVIFGAREIEVEERKIIEKTGVKIVYYDDILRKGIDNVLDEIKDYLKIDNLHISIDMNVFDPEIAPGVSVPVRRGMSYDEMFKSLKFVFKNYSVTSADITEFNPLNDINGKTAELVDDIVQYMMNPDY